MLDFYQVSFRVGHVDKRQLTNAINIRFGYFPHRSTPVKQYLISGMADVVNRKRQMPQPLSIWDGRQIGFDLLVLVDFQGRSLLIVSGQEKMHSLNLGMGDSSTAGQPLTRLIPFRGCRYTREHVAVKLNQPSPISGNDIRMCVSHERVLKKVTSRKRGGNQC